jgi:hypothetical protein
VAAVATPGSCRSSAGAHPSAALPEPLFTIEIADPDDDPDEE